MNGLRLIGNSRITRWNNFTASALPSFSWHSAMRMSAVDCTCAIGLGVLVDDFLAYASIAFRRSPVTVSVRMAACSAASADGRCAATPANQQHRNRHDLVVQRRRSRAPANELFATYGIEQEIALRYLSVGPANDSYGTRVMGRYWPATCWRR